MHPEPPPPAAPAHRLRATTWLNGRTALGAALVLLAILAGALFLDHAQRLVPVYAAARDLPAGTPLKSGDLVVVRVRMPASALRHYLRPSPGRAVPGHVLTAPVRRDALVPAELVLASGQDADLVELPVQVDQGDMAQGLRPGDRVQVLAAFTEGARRGRAVVLLPSAEVVAVLEDPAGLTGSGQERGVQLRMPSDRAPVVAAAIATARIFVVKAPGLGADPAVAPTPPSGVQEPQTGAGTPDEGPAGAAPPDTDPLETGPVGTGPLATGPEGTGSGETGPPATGSPDAGSPDASAPGTRTAVASPTSSRPATSLPSRPWARRWDGTRRTAASDLTSGARR